MDADAVVIGAGAAGMMAALHAARRGRKVLLLEKNRKAGVKILMSGGSRCNITHHTDRAGIRKAFGKQGPFLNPALGALGPDEVVRFFNDAGVATKTEETGKVFPVSDRALDVRDALVRTVLAAGVVMELDEPVLSVTPREAEGGFVVHTRHRQVCCGTVLVTTGGVSYPGCGTTGDGYGWAERFGHAVRRPRPALTPVKVGEGWVKALSGVTIPDVRVAVAEGDRAGGAGKLLSQDRGSFLFTHFGLSGPVVLNVSKAVSTRDDPHGLALECDFAPAVGEEALDGHLQAASLYASKKALAGVLGDHVPRRLAEGLLQLNGHDPGRPAGDLKRDHRRLLVAGVKRSRLPVAGTLGFEKAEVTTGGVALEEIDNRTMMSRRQPNLFFAGEVLDLDGPIGGYNFQAAFSTGHLAGRHL